jgi:hypothetical protein
VLFTAPGARRTLPGEREVGDVGDGSDDRRSQRRQPWEIRAQVEIDTLRAMALQATPRAHPCPDPGPWAEHLFEAEGYIADGSSPRKWFNGTRVEGTWGHIDASVVDMVRCVFSDEQILGMAPRLRATFARTLGPLRPERVAACAVLEQVTGDPPAEIAQRDREILAGAIQAANDSNAANYQRLRRFQSKLIGASGALFVLVVMLVALGWWRPHLVPLCFPDPDAPVEEQSSADTADAAVVQDNAPVEPARVICPSTPLPPRADTGTFTDAALGDGDARADNADVLTVVLFGLVGASLTSVAFVIRPAPATALPASSIRLFQALVKAETGIIAAVLGLLFLRAGVVPGFTHVDTRSQILVYAVVFGASQQLITRLIDARSDTLLGSVKTNASPAVTGSAEQEVETTT